MRFLARAAALAWLCVSCRCGTDAASPAETIPLTIAASTGAAITLSVETADDDAERAQGLMYRAELDESAGMIFLFPDEDQRSFWMKNTPLSLDLLFLSAEKEIVYIAADAVPYSESVIAPATPAQYVLEVNGGFCARHGVQVGDRVAF